MDLVHMELFLCSKQSIIVRVGSTVAEMEFLMLDPNLNTRITARQMVAVLQNEYTLISILRDHSCATCKESFPLASNPYLPYHSTFKPVAGLMWQPIQTEREIILQTEVVADNWEQVKRLCLASHM